MVTKAEISDVVKQIADAYGEEDRKRRIERLAAIDTEALEALARKLRSMLGWSDERLRAFLMERGLPMEELEWLFERRGEA